MINAQNINQTAYLFSALGKPVRLRILLAIGRGEACVCHLESVVGKRQAYLSQQLMALREAGLLETRREGKYVFYRLCKPELLALVQQAAEIGGMPTTEIEAIVGPQLKSDCPCPHCEDTKSSPN